MAFLYSLKIPIHIWMGLSSAQWMRLLQIIAMSAWLQITLLCRSIRYHCGFVLSWGFITASILWGCITCTCSNARLLNACVLWLFEVMTSPPIPHPHWALILQPPLYFLSWCDIYSKRTGFLTLTDLTSALINWFSETENQIYKS